MAFWNKHEAESQTEGPPPVTQAAGWHGPESMRALLVPVEDLTLDEANVRKHPERNIGAIKASLLRFGQRKPVVVRDGKVVAGNGTLEAARQIPWTHLAVVAADDLSPEEARAYAIADNKTGDLAEWDYQALGEQFRELPEDLLAATGFADFEVEPLLRAQWEPRPETSGSEPYGHSLALTSEQWTVVKGALAKVREQAPEGPEMTDGRALELLAADWLSGA